MKFMLPEEKKFVVFVKEKSKTNPEYGKKPENRTVEEKLNNSIVLIDKPYGPTSHQVSFWVKKILKVKKTGHSGTLDPHVTGVLPIALGKGTKIIQALKTADKEYVCVMELNRGVDIKKVKEVAKTFVGEIKQTPPKISAVKKVERTRKIYYLDILEVEGKNVLFKIGCEKGFYVRVFCKQFAKALNRKGFMSELRRTKVGLFNENNLVFLQDLIDEYVFWKEEKENRLNEILLPIEEGIKHLEKIYVKDSAVNSLCYGSPLGTSGISKLTSDIKRNQLVAILTLKGELVALGKSLMDSQEILNKEGTAVKLERVFMEKDTYPKLWKNQD